MNFIKRNSEFTVRSGSQWKSDGNLLDFFLSETEFVSGNKKSYR